MALKDVLTIASGVRGPNQIAVSLARAADRKKDPVIAAAVITRDQDGNMAVGWTTQNTGEVAEMLMFLHAVVLDSLKEAWVYEDADDYEDEDGA